MIDKKEEKMTSSLLVAINAIHTAVKLI